MTREKPQKTSYIGFENFVIFRMTPLSLAGGNSLHGSIMTTSRLAWYIQALGRAGFQKRLCKTGGISFQNFFFYYLQSIPKTPLVRFLSQSGNPLLIGESSIKPQIKGSFIESSPAKLKV